MARSAQGWAIGIHELRAWVKGSVQVLGFRVQSLGFKFAEAWRTTNSILIQSVHGYSRAQFVPEPHSNQFGSYSVHAALGLDSFQVSGLGFLARKILSQEFPDEFYCVLFL